MPLLLVTFMFGGPIGWLWHQGVAAAGDVMRQRGCWQNWERIMKTGDNAFGHHSSLNGFFRRWPLR
jgi:hypothetical protein